MMLVKNIQPNKELKAVARRLAFYSKWYCSMDDFTIKSSVGSWVLSRIEIFSDLIKEMNKPANEGFQKVAS